MPRPIPYETRCKIIRDHKAGIPVADIAAETGRSIPGIRKIIKTYSASAGDESSLRPRYNNGTRHKPFAPEILEYVEAAASSRKGAPYVSCVLAEAHPDLRVPSARTIQRMWRKQLGPRARTPYGPRSSAPRASEAHETWQVDGKEKMTLADGSPASWLMVVDEASGAALGGTASPPGDDG